MQVKALVLLIVLKEPGPGHQLFVIRCQSTATAGGDDLIAVEAQHTDFSQLPQAFS